MKSFPYKMLSLFIHKKIIKLIWKFYAFWLFGKRKTTSRLIMQMNATF